MEESRVQISLCSTILWNSSVIKHNFSILKITIELMQNVLLKAAKSPVVIFIDY